ncbi:glycine-rich protein DOT1-like [Lytechinus variegatus]|uniref:glycine-rich protein DOT1-like n=1 Tax=Lytechinus variegatus TaxID=7654 RepID=UPI001BB2C56C|nr:glycine-rich protein DOT1-like [Lytechinus variegatus]XP_041465625.1 glycine-rich protein DOT1-like [Lytechinus variegatus]
MGKRRYIFGILTVAFLVASTLVITAEGESDETGNNAGQSPSASGSGKGGTGGGGVIPGVSAGASGGTGGTGGGNRPGVFPGSRGGGTGFAGGPGGGTRGAGGRGTGAAGGGTGVGGRGTGVGILPDIQVIDPMNPAIGTGSGSRYPGYNPRSTYPGQTFPGSGIPGQRFPHVGNPGMNYPGRYPTVGHGGFPGQGVFPGQHFPGQHYPGSTFPGRGYPPHRGIPGSIFPPVFPRNGLPVGGPGYRNPSMNPKRYPGGGRGYGGRGLYPAAGGPGFHGRHLGNNIAEVKGRNFGKKIGMGFGALMAVVVIGALCVIGTVVSVLIACARKRRRNQLR